MSSYTPSYMMSDHLLNRSITGSLGSTSDSTRTIIVEHLWQKTAKCRTKEDFSAYFDKHYTSQCMILGIENPLKTHRDAMDLVSHIRTHCQEPKELLRESIRSYLPRLDDSKEQLDKAIDLATRLWLMINLESSSQGLQGIRILPQTGLPWPDNLNLADVLRMKLLNASVQETKNMRFTKFLNLVSLTRIGRFTIHWTENILDHLSLEEDRVICIFHHVSVLRRLKVSQCPVLPADFLDETLRTIALLVPTADAECYRWLLKDGHGLDPGIQSLEWASREVSKYSYWRDRLLILEEAFEEAEPATLTQWWYDRRKKVQWYTFWVAILVLILTIVFGIIQSITGILQAWKTLQS